jgi:serine/threonine-protein kinase
MTNMTTLPKLSEMTYRVVKPLGTGAGSTILLITDKTAGGQRYALKVVKRHNADDDVYIAQAQLEYHVAQRLNHQSIVKIYDLRVKRSWFRITGVELLMEFVEGRTLDEIEAPGLNRLVLVFNQVAAALMHMHRRGVYHGDLKPSNIMVSNEGRVKLIDFGTAWVKGEEKNRVQGTPQYMAPEQAAERVVDERTDIYNLGATMYRMFTGRYAQQGIPTAGEAGVRKLTPPIQLLPSLPGTLNETILRCLEINPDRRPAGVFEIKNQLTAVAKYLGLDPSASRVGSLEDQDQDDDSGDDA